MSRSTNTGQIHIPNPCSQPWEDMHPLPGGRYCTHCEKTVVDFTQFTDRQLATYLRDTAPGRTCGHFRADQLGRDLVIPSLPRRLVGWRWVGAVASGFLLGMGTAWGQSAASVPATEIAAGYMAASSGQSEQERYLRGSILDNNDEPLFGCNVALYQGEHLVGGTIADSTGHFAIKIPTDVYSFRIRCTMVGYQDMEKEYAAVPTSTVQYQLVAGVNLPEVIVSAIGIRLIENITGGGVTRWTEKGEQPSKPIPFTTPTIHVYPNPFTESVQLAWDLDAPRSIRLHLFNSNAELLQIAKHDLAAGPQQLTFSLNNPHWPAGTYFLRILDDQGEIVTKQLVKGH